MRAALAGAVGFPGREGIGSGQSYAFLQAAAVQVGPQQLRVHLGADEDEFLRIRAGGVTSRGRLEASHRTGLRPQSRHSGPAGGGEEALGPEDLPVGAAARCLRHQRLNRPGWKDLPEQRTVEEMAY